MDVQTFTKLLPRYQESWPWLAGLLPTDEQFVGFVGRTEHYEELPSGYKKRRAFWNSKFWAWLKRNKQLEYQKGGNGNKCQQCNTPCNGFHLHHVNKDRYYHPIPADLELTCPDCHSREHYQGKYSPDYKHQQQTSKQMSEGKSTAKMDWRGRIATDYNDGETSVITAVNEAAAIRKKGNKYSEASQPIHLLLVNHYKIEYMVKDVEGLTSDVLDKLNIIKKVKKAKKEETGKQAIPVPPVKIDSVQADGSCSENLEKDDLNAIVQAAVTSVKNAGGGEITIGKVKIRL